MNNEKISIIVPVYKAEKYIENCIASIVNQTYKNLEIILVDDGSPDNCPEICDEWVKKDDRIVVIHKEKGGVSSARNAGLDVATGDYVGFVDSDDYIYEEMYERLLKSCIENNSDMSVCGVDHNGHKKCFDKSDVYSSEQAIGLMFDRSVSAFEGYTCNKLYKADVINKNGIRFDCNIKMCEDTKINYQYLLCANKVSVVDYCGYYYAENQYSACNNNSVRLGDSVIAVTSEFVKAVTPQQSYYDLMLNWCLQHWLGFINVVLLNNFDKSMANGVVDLIKSNFVSLIKSKNISHANKIQVLIITISKKIYYQIRGIRG